MGAPRPKPPPLQCEATLTRKAGLPRGIAGEYRCDWVAKHVVLFWDESHPTDFWRVMLMCSRHRTYALRRKDTYVLVVPLESVPQSTPIAREFLNGC